MKSLKKQMQHRAIGIFSKTTDSALVEATGIAGLDFIILDMEHGPATFESMHHHVRAAKLGNIASIIRVSSNDSHAIGCALDAGADGVQIPNISTPEQAQNAVNSARFHPNGQRGVCRFVRSANFGEKNRNTYFQNENEKLLILQVEGLEGIKNLDKILDVVGFDVLFIGPYDLSQSVGKPGDIECSEVTSLINTIAKKTKDRNILLGSFSDSLERNNQLNNQGFNYIAYSVDINIYIEACKKIIGD